MDNNPIIKFDKFSFKYNAQQDYSLKDISLEIRKGEKVLIVGQSGSGKSTLGNCINGLIPFSYPGEIKGTCEVNGKSTQDLGIFELSKIVGTVLQDSDGQFVGLTVAEDIAFALENDCVETPELHTRVKSAAKKVDIQNFLHHAPSELSGGQKQRVSLAGIMVDNVDVFLFDEPLANLDPATGKSAIELIDSISSDTGAAVIIIEHRLEDVLWRHVDRVILMSEGRIISDTSADELLCSNLLVEKGIREPLYITALKYAGVKISPDMHPWSIHEISLNDSQKEAVRSWYLRNPFVRESVNSEPIISIKDVNFSYDNGCKAIKGISLDINKGEMLAIVGTNGAGKSTMAKIICGFIKPQSGAVTLKGNNLTDMSIKEIADYVGYVMQNPNQMISKVQILDEVSLGLVNRGADAETVLEQSGKAIRICGLWPFRNWPISALSYGQKKRVTIASILSMNPDVLILDEPTAGQDYRHYTEIMEFLREINEMGITVIMITHDMHLMLEYAGRTVVFNNGRVIADSTGADILTSPEIVEKANLKETSLYDLAIMCGIDEPKLFVQHFIDYDREARG